MILQMENAKDTAGKYQTVYNRKCVLINVMISVCFITVEQLAGEA